MSYNTEWTGRYLVELLNTDILFASKALRGGIVPRSDMIKEVPESYKFLFIKSGYKHFF